MKQLFGFSLVILCMVASSCHKHSSGPSAGYGPNSIFPLTSGDTWYYNDSTFGVTSGTVALTGYTPDTMVATSTIVQDPNTGIAFVGVSNPNGWFNNAYIAVSDDNSTIYQMDYVDSTQSYSYPYIFFEGTSQDGTVDQGKDITNPSCPIYYAQYAYATPTTVANYSSYKNVYIVQDCNNIVLQEVINYVSPGVGVVRMEEYTTDTTGGVNTFYEDYSQTLTGLSLKK